MRVVIQGIERLGGLKQRRIRETVALLKRDYPIDTNRRLTIRFCNWSERARIWRGVGSPPRGFFNQEHPRCGVIDNTGTMRQLVRCVASTWRYAQFATDALLQTHDDADRAYKVASEFATEIAALVLGEREEAA